ncbi:hypothetical protein JMF94_14830 [Desulfovibrio sp. UIB00]|uniref:hypothetical protein n=1 Tax=Desulfovibrio sp. UIB00 TaxID=2804314 RepID=UPI001F101641|nr:hypothetical protein [Desulfovibrio sp. UIB00]MCH5146356.1 hypothetical protein [Desulfovibrio sp. UIB00]
MMPEDLGELAGLLHDLGVPAPDVGRYVKALSGALHDSKRFAKAHKAIQRLLEARNGQRLGLQGAGLLAYLAAVYTALSENESDRIQRERIAKEIER